MLCEQGPVSKGKLLQLMKVSPSLFTALCICDCNVFNISLAFYDA